MDVHVARAALQSALRTRRQANGELSLVAT
jgi:hypothetical protein